ncbi:MAG: hypothetical protein KGD64_04445 [Candidatus Heimdallarchaeota archaeon]|nr:hypothetical protein [Candidatus Heimdallarchaeota archaeon]
MKKKNMKTKLSMSFTVLIIYFLISTSSLNTVSTQALLEENKNSFNTDSFDQSTWKWTTTEVISTESTGLSGVPSLAIDTLGNVHVVWSDLTNYDGSGTDFDVFYKRWEASTSSWTTTEVVSTESTGYSVYPNIAVDSTGNAHIAWFDASDYASSGWDSDIFYKRWDASSSSWTTTEVVSTESTDWSGYPSLTVDSEGNVHISWEDDTDYAGSGTDKDIFYKQWEASTTSWKITEIVSTESTGISQLPSLAVDTLGDVYIAWEDWTDYSGVGTDQDIFYKQWNASTSSWTTTEVVSTESTNNSTYTSLAVDTLGNIHVAWEDETDYAGSGTDKDIFYKQWDASSSSWVITEVISTESTNDSNYTSLAVDSAGNIHLAWQDLTDYAGSGIDNDIFYKRWEASFSTWTTTDVVSTESTGMSIVPSLAVDTVGNVHIAWDDPTDYAGSGTDRDIFYKVLTGPPTEPELAFIVPNPTDSDIVNLDWNNVPWVSAYYVYRSTTYIWSVEGLIPIASVSSSDYIDTVPSEGFYYYVVVAGNLAGNSSLSNCQYIEINFPDLDVPELAPLLPNPTEIDSISLVWNNIDGATEYYIYRSNIYIWSVQGLTPIATVVSNSFIDSLPSEGIYFYVIVASDGIKNSTHSNCMYIEYKLPTLNEFALISGLIFGVFVILYVVTRKLKKQSK